MREALFALAHIEEELLYGRDVKTSNLIETLDKAMLNDDKYWKKHYQGTDLEIRLKRKYSFIQIDGRYYMPLPEVNDAINTLIDNLNTYGIPLNLLSQFSLFNIQRIREGKLDNNPEALIVDRIINTIDEYLYATNQSELY